MNLKYGLFLAFAVLITACLEKKEILDVSTHPAGWMLQSSENFHGNAVKSSELQNPSGSCQTCHGDSYDGGASQVSCYDAQCHTSYPHPENFADPNSATSHIDFIRNEINWDITKCQGCHGADYAGKGSYDKNCLKCHQKEDGPENCSLCHGSNDNPAPPKDLNDNELTTNIGVGAHQAHLDSTWSTAFELNCKMCHIEPNIFNMAGHVDDSTPNAEVNFSLFASQYSNGTPVWNHETATCSDVYCHGAFKFSGDSSSLNFWIYSDSGITGNNNPVVWNSVGTGQAECGTCHGLPPKGHFDRVTACEQCHSSVVGPGLEIINKKLHINGKIDLH